MRAAGEMPEWPNGIDSKSIVAAMPPRVRIPVSPPIIKGVSLIHLLFLQDRDTNQRFGGGGAELQTSWLVCNEHRTQKPADFTTVAGIVCEISSFDQAILNRIAAADGAAVTSES